MLYCCNSDYTASVLCKGEIKKIASVKRQRQSRSERNKDIHIDD